MKEIIINENNLTDNDVSKFICRAKLVVENSKGELLIVKTDESMFFIGGHVDNDETDMETLRREINEEAGIDYKLDIKEPFYSIKYLTKDYPEVGTNTGYITNYYVLQADDFIPDMENSHLEESEKNSNFRLMYLSREDCVKELETVLATTKKVNVVRDTLDVVKYYIETYCK